VVLLIALRAVDTTEVARVDGLDGEEDRLAPHSIPVQQIADAGGDSIQMSQILHGV
jgi:hypothetical protein